MRQATLGTRKLERTERRAGETEAGRRPRQGLGQRPARSRHRGRHGYRSGNGSGGWNEDWDWDRDRRGADTGGRHGNRSGNGSGGWNEDWDEDWDRDRRGGRHGNRRGGRHGNRRGNRSGGGDRYGAETEEGKWGRCGGGKEGTNPKSAAYPDRHLSLPPE